MLKKIKSLRSKKGASVLEFAFGLLTFVLLVAFVVDVIIIANKQFVVSQTANEIVRQIAVQGGVMRTAPEGYQGGNNAYVDSGEMFVQLSENFRDAGMSDRNWSMRLDGYDANGVRVQSEDLSNRTNFSVDYRDNFEFEIKYEYNWAIIGQLIPPMRENRDVSQKRSSVSEFKYMIN